MLVSVEARGKKMVYYINLLGEGRIKERGQIECLERTAIFLGGRGGLNQ